MNRNSPLSRAGCLAMLAVAVLLASACAPITAPHNMQPAAQGRSVSTTPITGARPNIIYILADDLGYGDIGAFGQTKIDTPHLDRLAREGLVFTQHYAGSSVCAPSRASLLSGQHTGNLQIRGNYEFGGFLDENEFGQMPLDPSSVTIAEVMRENGYRTGIIGKWGLGGPGSEGEPGNHGFDYFFGYLDQKQAHNYYPTHLWRNGERVALGNPFFVPHPATYGGSQRAEDYRDYMGPDFVPDILAKEAEEFIARNHASPFVLFYTPTIPHAALQVPDALLERYEGRWEEEPLHANGYTPHPRPRAARAALITLLDTQIGAMREQLHQLGIADNTLIIFTSDNGASSEGGADLAFFESNGGLRGEKRDLYEGGIRVPMIAHWPGRIAAGTSTDHLSAIWDVLPTFAQLAGGKAPDAIDGLSFAEVLTGSEPRAVHRYLYWEFHGGNPTPAQAIRQGDWKLVRLRPEDAAVTEQLYNLADDPGETIDLSASHPAQLAQLGALMDKARSVSPHAGFNFDPGKGPRDP